jgi:hypothetical protein
MKSVNRRMSLFQLKVETENFFESFIRRQHATGYTVAHVHFLGLRGQKLLRHKAQGR